MLTVLEINKIQIKQKMSIKCYVDITKYFKQMKSIFSILFLFLAINVSIAQNNASALKETINSQLNLLDTFPQTLNNGQTFDPDSLSAVISDNIVLYLQTVGFNHFDINDFNQLELISNAENQPLSVITFSYYSGGTAGIIPTSIIVKNDNGSYNYYDMSKYEAGFYEFYQLNNNIYLCFATVPGWGACANNGLFAFDFEQEALPVDIFNNKPYISICNSDISFDRQTKTLKIEIDSSPNYDAGSDYQSYFDKIGFNFFKIDPGYVTYDNFLGTLTSQFNGQKFVKPF